MVKVEIDFVRLVNRILVAGFVPLQIISVGSSDESLLAREIQGNARPDFKPKALVRRRFGQREIIIIVEPAKRSRNTPGFGSFRAGETGGILSFQADGAERYQACRSDKFFHT